MPDPVAQLEKPAATLAVSRLPRMGFRVVAAADKKTAEIQIYDSIGKDWWTGEGVGAKDVAEQLKAIGDVEQIDVRINSNGGSVWDGLAIYNALAQSKAKIIVHIDGIALSAASFIAMAGGEIRMAENALMMIHNASGVEFGNAAAMRKMAEMLDTHDQAIIGIYAARTNQPPAEITALMAAETWFTAPEAQAKGFATAITPNKTIAAAFNPANFSNVPEWAKNRLAEFRPPQDEIMTTPTTEMKDTPAPKTEPEASATVLPPVDAAAIQTAERKRTTDILAACKLAGRPELADKFIGDGNPLADVNASLLAAVCKDRPPVGDSGAGGGATEPDENAKYKTEYAAQKAAYAKAGMSEADYVGTRRLDDGLDTLATKSA